MVETGFQGCQAFWRNLFSGLAPPTPLAGGGAARQITQQAEQNGNAGDVERDTAECCPPPRWMPIAKGEIGVRETSGVATTPRVMEYHEASGFTWRRESRPGAGDLRVDDSRTVDAWCASFVTWTMRQAGYARSDLATDPFRAREWHDRWPKGRNVGRPIYGAIGVQQTHVGFIVGHKPGDPDMLAMLGGNQGNSVKISWYRKSSFKGFWVPDDYPHECCTLEPYEAEAADGDRETTR